MKSIWIILALVLTGCGSNGEIGYRRLETMPSIKLGEMAHMDSESTPVVFGNRVVVLTTLRWGPNSNPPRLFIRDFDTRAIVYDAPISMDYICAYVENGTLYMFGVTGNIPGKGQIAAPGNSIVMSKTTDLVTWTAPTTVYTFDADISGYNLSVTKTNNGYVMAYDYGDDSERPMWKQKFLQSADLINWTAIPFAIHKRNYWSAGATIRYYSGWYYLIYHTETGDGRFATKVNRSPDLVTWFEGNKWLMTPTESYEGINTSDLDLVEFNGQVYFSYMTGNQKTWSGVALATVNGLTEKQVLEGFF